MLDSINFNANMHPSSSGVTSANSADSSAGMGLLLAILSILMDEFKKGMKEDEGKMQELMEELQKIMKELKAVMSSPNGGADLSRIIVQLDVVEKQFHNLKTEMQNKINGMVKNIGNVADAIEKLSTNPKQKLELQELVASMKVQLTEMEENFEKSVDQFAETCKGLHSLINKLSSSTPFGDSSGLQTLQAILYSLQNQ